MLNIVAFSLISFVLGVISTLAIIRLLGGNPAWNEQPHCVDGNIIFSIRSNPFTSTYIKCCKVVSFLDGIDPVVHLDSVFGDPHATFSRSFPLAEEDVNVTVKCTYAIIPSNEASVSAINVDRCYPPSLSSSSSSNSSSSNLSSSSSSSSGP